MPGDSAAILNDAIRSVREPSRRAFLQRTLTLGGLSLLTGCSISDNASVESALMKVSEFNDRVQGVLFDPNRLAPTYPDSMITRPFPFNAFYGEDEVKEVDGSAWRLELSGLVMDKKPWSLAQLRNLPQTDQVTRHICVEGWSAIGKWGGVPFSHFLKRIGADLSAKYVGFKCADDYYTSIDMATALHPQTLMALTYDGEELPPKYGYPMKLRMPTKLGYKNPKHIQAMFVTNTYPGGYWEDQGYNWFGGS
ncbi:molybdopterin-dependent oxidoreductase [Herminiimonas aquatilis]|uniref:Molybdopterin-dependent oxidoreductase n=1 Tax=Herminiimonas aquatilis TaxID=345342 RepID=A0ABW2J4B6_9BURK